MVVKDASFPYKKMIEFRDGKLLREVKIETDPFLLRMLRGNIPDSVLYIPFRNGVYNFLWGNDFKFGNSFILTAIITFLVLIFCVSTVIYGIFFGRSLHWNDFNDVSVILATIIVLIIASAAIRNLMQTLKEFYDNRKLIKNKKLGYYFSENGILIRTTKDYFQYFSNQEVKSCKIKKIYWTQYISSDGKGGGNYSFYYLLPSLEIKIKISKKEYSLLSFTDTDIRLKKIYSGDPFFIPEDLSQDLHMGYLNKNYFDLSGANIQNPLKKLTEFLRENKYSVLESEEFSEDDEEVEDITVGNISNLEEF